jgi:glycosyltransferase involved in cell wall biosynthesis
MTVSILLPIYNRADTLRRCLESVRTQTFTDWELIAVDDGSTDGSVEVIASYGDARFRLLRHERNRGASAARNTALAAAQGEFVALIDSDDEWLPTKLERQLALLRSGQWDACGCEYFLEDAGRETHVRLPEPPSWREELHVRCQLGNGTTLCARRDCLEAIGPLDEELRLYEDWDWMLRFTQKYRYTVLPEPLARVHVSGGRDPRLFARNSEHFLTRHDAEFARLGAGHRALVRSLHFEYVASNAFARRAFALGCRYTLKSFFAAPARRPLQLGALLLAPFDAFCGTSLLLRAAAWSRGKERA